MSRLTHKEALGIALRTMRRGLAPVLLTLVLFLLCFLPVSKAIEELALISNYQVLLDLTEQVAADLRSELKRDLGQLELTASILTEYPALDGSMAQHMLLSLQRHANAVQTGLLLSTGQLLTTTPGPLDEFGLSFDEEAGNHTGTREVRGAGGRNYILQTTPVRHDGPVTAILCGVWDLDEFSGRYFGYQSDFLVISGRTGAYLIGSHQMPEGNFYGPEPPGWLALDDGDWQSVQEELRGNRLGGVECQRTEDGEDCFLMYQPVGVDDWMIMIPYPQTYLFQLSEFVRDLMFQMVWVELALLVPYMVLLFVYNRRKINRRKQETVQMGSQLDIQQTLFSAHQNPSCIYTALSKAAGILTAEAAFLLSQTTCQQETYIWPKEGAVFGLGELQLPRLREKFMDDGSILLDTRQRLLRPSGADLALLRQHQITSLMAVPIFDSGQQLIGILGAINTKKKWTQTDLLENIAHNFMMALENIRSYRIIEQMGVMDALTGLKNRNSYQRTLIERDGMIAGCVYLDANGLHELNNTYGHAAGDALLRAVGDGLRAYFGPEESYRIGGDEFVVLCGTTRSEEEAAVLLNKLRARIEGQGYHVSAGLAWRERGQALDAVTTCAEERMYADKQRYYESLGNPDRKRR